MKKVKEDTRTLFIKNMVCLRCMEAVKGTLKEVNIPFISIELGKVQIKNKISIKQKQQLKALLHEKGFELIEDRNTRLVNEIKSIIIEEIHHKEEASPVNFSTLLSEKLHYEYTHLSRLFSAMEGQTIEKFVLAQKIEKVKELLTYDELSLAEIAFQMNYSSSAHLSSQFKKIMGMTPSAFKKTQSSSRKMLDKV